MWLFSNWSKSLGHALAPETQGEKGTGAEVDSWNTAGGVGKEGRKETQGKQTTAKGGKLARSKKGKS